MKMKPPDKTYIKIKKGTETLMVFLSNVKKGAYPTYDGKKMKKNNDGGFYLKIK